MKYFSRLLIMACLLASGSINSTNAYASAQKTPECLILLGGGGMVFSNEAMNNMWFKINSGLSTHIADDLEKNGYKVERLIVDIRDNPDRLKALSSKVTETKCTKIVQVSNSLSGVAGGGIAKFFVFNISVLSVDESAINAKIYNKDYSFPLTKEVMETLSMSSLAQRISDDIDASHAINKVQVP